MTCIETNCFVFESLYGYVRVPAVVAFVARLRWIMELIDFGANSVSYGAN